MNRKKIDLSEERQIVINLIVSERFLKEIIPILNIKYFSSYYAQLVSSWCIEYYQEYKDAPGKNIQKIYEQKKQTIRGEEESELVRDFMISINKEWQQIQEIHNIDYSIRAAIKYLKIRSLEILKENLEIAIIEADPLKGEQYISNYSKIEHGREESISLLHDTKEVQEAFLQEDEILFSFPGKLGEVVGNFLRGDLVSFLGVAKSGKTWWLWYIAKVAMSEGWRVLFVTLEMPRRQMIRRAWQSMVGSPKKNKEVTIPEFIDIEKSEDKTKSEIKIKKEERKGVKIEEIKTKQKKFRY